MGKHEAAQRKTHSPTVSTVRRTAVPFFRPAGGSGFFGVQAKLSVSRPGDAMEHEADRTATTVMRSAAPQVAGAADGQVQRLGDGSPTVAADAGTAIKQASTGGQPLSAGTRAFMEPRFGADFGDVRVHTDEEAASLSNHLSARAFTHGQHIFFARDQYQPGTDEGRHLLAHELTHTIQQGASVQRAPAADAAPVVATPGATPAVQRLGVRDALDYFADRANNLPGFRMLTLVLGFNPINGRSADRTAANLLRALIELVPGGAVITQVLDNHGVINRAATWVEQQLATLGDIGGQIRAAISSFLDSLGWSDILHLGGVWDRARRIVTDPISRLIAFGANAVSTLLSFVKEAILRPLADLAARTPAYDLLKAVLGRDPVTGDPFPRTADTLIGGFMKLIGQEELWNNLKRGNAVGRAFAWFQGALSGLLGFVTSIPQRIVQTITSLTFTDVITVVGAFRKVGSAFLDVVGQFTSWAGRQVLSLLEILVSVVAPGVMPYIAKAQAAFHTIIQDPVRFVGNLVRAGKLGFQQFAGRIGVHLRTALIRWITGPLGEAGVYIPTAFTLTEILKLVLSVLGLTWQNIRSKLVRIIPEPILVGLERTASVLVTLVQQGPAAAWEQIKGELTELKDQLIGQVTEMISSEVVKAAVTKLVSMLNPAGAVIQAIIATYNTVMFFIERARQIGAVVASFIDSIASIAAGNIAGAANRVEETLANGLTVAISFLARFVGLGGIPNRVVGVVRRIRQPIDRGLDKIVGWLGTTMARLTAPLRATATQIRAGVAAGGNWVRQRAAAGAAAIRGAWASLRGSFRLGTESHSLFISSDNQLMVASTPERASVKLARWVELAETARDAAQAASARALLAAVIRCQQTIHIATRIGDEAGAANARAYFGEVLRAMQYHAATYGRRMLSRGTDVREGLILPYDRQPTGGGTAFEREHIVPASVVAGWLGVRRDSEAIGLAYQQMTTLMWRGEAADIKTRNDAALWTSMQRKREELERLMRLRERGSLSVAEFAAARARLMPSLSALLEDRIQASIRAARQAGSAVTEADIRAAGTTQIRQVESLVQMFHQMQTRSDGS